MLRFLADLGFRGSNVAPVVVQVYPHVSTLRAAWHKGSCSGHTGNTCTALAALPLASNHPPPALGFWCKSLLGRCGRSTQVRLLPTLVRAEANTVLRLAEPIFNVSLEAIASCVGDIGVFLIVVDKQLPVGHASMTDLTKASRTSPGTLSECAISFDSVHNRVWSEDPPSCVRRAATRRYACLGNRLAISEVKLIRCLPTNASNTLMF